MRIDSFRIQDLDGIELDGIVQPLDPRGFEDGKEMAKVLWLERGGHAVTARDDIGNVLYIMILVRLTETRGLVLMYVDQVGARQYGFRIARSIKTHADEWTRKAGLHEVIGTATDEQDRFMRFVGFEKTTWTVDGDHGKSFMWVREYGANSE